MNQSNGPDPSQVKASENAFDEVTNDNDAMLPGIDFATFVLSMSHSALVHLGDAPAPDESSTSVNLPMARQTIDLLALLQDKTRGNLSGEEERIMEQVLYDLRMRYVEVAKQS